MLLIAAVPVSIAQKKHVTTTKRTVSSTMLNGIWIISENIAQSPQKTGQMISCLRVSICNSYLRVRPG